MPDGELLVPRGLCVQQLLLMTGRAVLLPVINCLSHWHLPTEDEIPSGAILNEEEKGAGAGAGPRHRHVFKKPEEYFY